jgi:hypothetical protein
MSDPRISGTETQEGFRFIGRVGGGDVWVAEETRHHQCGRLLAW